MNKINFKFFKCKDIFLYSYTNTIFISTYDENYIEFGNKPIIIKLIKNKQPISKIPKKIKFRNNRNNYRMRIK